MVYVILVSGILVLVKGADILVNSASKLAKMLGVPAFIIGLSIVAFGTSAPEAAVGILSGLRGANQLTLGDVIGSSIANIALIIGLTASIAPLRVERVISLREIPISLGLQLLLTAMLVLDGSLSRSDAFILFLIMAAFIYYLTRRTADIMERQDSAKMAEDYPGLEKQENLREELEDLMEKEKVLAPSLGPIKDRRGEIIRLSLWVLLGLAMLIVGANLIVDSAVKIAQNLGLSEAFIGLTVIAVGTSLPELVTSLLATLRKEDELAVGNIIGSNIFNIAFVLGVSGMISPIRSSPEIVLDIVVMCLTTLMIFIPALRYEQISRRSGFIFVSSYFLFIAYKIAQL